MVKRVYPVRVGRRPQAALPRAAAVAVAQALRRRRRVAAHRQRRRALRQAAERRERRLHVKRQQLEVGTAHAAVALPLDLGVARAQHRRDAGRQQRVRRRGRHARRRRVGWRRRAVVQAGGQCEARCVRRGRQQPVG
eukprot:4268257-Prymnesium_polylepis.1